MRQLIKGIVLLTIIHLALAGQWSEWRDLTQCSAEPCGCKGDEEGYLCDHSESVGKKVQYRRCVHQKGEEFRACSFENNGPLRKVDCTSGDLCPVWSEWKMGECKCPAYEDQGNATKKRVCIQKSSMRNIYCTRVVGGRTQKAMKDPEIVGCTCTVIKTTTAAPPPTTTLEPICCPEDGNQPVKPICILGDENCVNPEVPPVGGFGDYCIPCKNGKPIGQGGSSSSYEDDGDYGDY